MKTLKQHIKDKDLEDFEEDLIGDKKPSENKNEKGEDKKEKEEKKMKTLKQHIKDKEYDDFEEDLMAESPPDTADAMKRYKAGKAGFTDKAHLKAKGLIARSDGEKRKSDKYK